MVAGRRARAPAGDDVLVIDVHVVEIVDDDAWHRDALQAAQVCGRRMRSMKR
jgi:hypothetical protein